MVVEWLPFVLGLVKIVGALTVVELAAAFLRWGADEGAAL